MNSKVYKWCAVPQCDNTSKKYPNKLFVYVPHNKSVREKWLNLARRDPTKIRLNSPLYFCEDHFDMPNDMTNFMEYHVMGMVSKVRMNPGCVPTRFASQIPDTLQTVPPETSDVTIKEEVIIKDEFVIEDEGVCYLNNASKKFIKVEPVESDTLENGGVSIESVTIKIEEVDPIDSNPFAS